MKTCWVVSVLRNGYWYESRKCIISHYDALAYADYYLRKGFSVKIVCEKTSEDIDNSEK